VILTMTLFILSAWATARERERGTLEQLIVSPLRRGELVGGKILPYMAMGLVQTTLILALGRLVCGVPVSGSLALLYAMALVFVGGSLWMSGILVTLVLFTSLRFRKKLA
jgi:ABC-2 type transport system permease protein